MFAGVDLLDLSEDDLQSMGLKDLALTNRVLKESALLVVSLIYEWPKYLTARYFNALKYYISQ